MQETSMTNTYTHHILRDAYCAGYAAGRSAAHRTVPRIGDPVDCEVREWIGHKVTPHNIREYHAALARLAEEHSRFLPSFERTADAFDGLGKGGFWARRPSGASIGPYDTRAAAEAEARDMWCDDAWNIEEAPSADEAWGAYDAGVSAGIRDAVAAYEYADVE